MIIYNLFPLLAGTFINWQPHMQRAADMGFDWLYVNPVQLPGKSGSLYSIKDYFDFNPLLIDSSDARSSVDQAKAAFHAAEQQGLKVMMDLVINHCAADSKLLDQHPDWFHWEHDGQVKHPSCDEDGQQVVWEDLAQFNHNTADREGLFQYYLKIIQFMIDLGVRGFRCDAAYQLPDHLWKRLIETIRSERDDIQFFAETLGCSPEQTLQTANAGFDYIFNSSKWWDFDGDWLLKQYNQTREVVPSISFAESHDTPRLCEELNGNIDGIKQRYLFSALFSAGVMMPMGFEFGFRKPMHVVNSRPEDWEQTDIDLTGFITQVNRSRSDHLACHQDTPTECLQHDFMDILLLHKTIPHSNKKCLLILNRHTHEKRFFSAERLSDYLRSDQSCIDISPEYTLDYVPSKFEYDLRPGQGIALYA